MLSPAFNWPLRLVAVWHSSSVSIRRLRAEGFSVVERARPRTLVYVFRVIPLPWGVQANQ